MPVVLQLSDPHLLEDPDALMRGVPTRQTLRDVIELARRRLPTIDRIVLTGDLAHDEEPGTYHALRELLGPDGPRSWVLPGNHDDRDGLRGAFGRQPGDDGTSIRFVDLLDDWCLVGLDSQITGHNEGRLGPAQRTWLQRMLLEQRDRPTVVFVHHHPVPTGHPWMDGMGLTDAADLELLLADAPQVRAVCHGHIHRELEGALGGVPVYGAPSTAFQFPADPDQGAYDFDPPGCRVLYLEPEGLRTEVLRLPTLEYVPVERSR